MEEHRIKSAWEIAQEKIAKIPDLTPGELVTQREREFGPVGEAIGRKFLEGAIRVTDLTMELNKHRGAEGQIVKRALVSILAQSVDPQDATRSRRAMEGLQALALTNKRFEELKSEFEGIVGEFDREAQRKCQAFETQEKERLQRLGISGSAMRPNINGNKDWQEELDRIRQSYDIKVDKLRQELVQLTEVV